HLWNYIVNYQGVVSDWKEVEPIGVGEFFFVKNWQFLSTEYPDAYYPYSNAINTEKIYLGVNANGMDSYGFFPKIRKENYKYEWLNTPEVVDLEGVPGQGNIANPYSDFGSHYIVLMNGKLYDPSYGLKYNTLKDWEEGSIDGYYIVEEVLSPNDPEKKYYYLRIRENLPETQDIKIN
ncbi:MAG: hypothetical protein MI974_13865, partial [Chitinophagales bacterium]|nr:hypothetical protein [Chitinophagales bacterium]